MNNEQERRSRRLVLSTVNFDDYTIIVPELHGATVDKRAGDFLKILWWDVKRAKDKPMAQTFSALRAGRPEKGPLWDPSYPQLTQAITKVVAEHKVQFEP